MLCIELRKKINIHTRVEFFRLDKNANLSWGKCSVSSGILNIPVTHPWSQNLAKWRKNGSRGRLTFITHTAMVKNLCCQISIHEKIHPLVFQCGFLSSEFEDKLPGLVVVESYNGRLLASSIQTQGMVHSIYEYGIVQCCTSRARINLLMNSKHLFVSSFRDTDDSNILASWTGF